MKRPLKDMLSRSEPGQATVDRVWAGVRARERRVRPVQVAALAAGVVLLIVGGRLWQTRERPLEGLVSPVAGLTLAAEPGTVAHYASLGGEVEVRVERGAVRVEARPGVRCVVTSRELKVEVASATARFEVGEGVRVWVEEGEVVVRGKRVRAGSAASSVPDDWRALAARGDLKAAWALLGADGVRREAVVGTAEQRTLLADISAAGEDLSLAVSLLEGVVASGAPSSERAVAAYDLGLRLVDLGAPERAALAFEQALVLDLPAALASDARARAAEAWLRTGDTARARRWLEAAETGANPRDDREHE